MRGVGVGFLFGMGLFLIWWSCWVPATPDSSAGHRRGHRDRLADYLLQAGYAAVSPGALVATCLLSTPASRSVIKKSGFQHAGNGMMNSIAAGPVSIERFVLDRKTWTSLRTWGR